MKAFFALSTAVVVSALDAKYLPGGLPNLSNLPNVDLSSINLPKVDLSNVHFPTIPGDIGAMMNCVAKVGNSNFDWSMNCKEMCFYYGMDAIHCPGNTDYNTLVQCVAKNHPYCLSSQNMRNDLGKLPGQNSFIGKPNQVPTTTSTTAFIGNMEAVNACQSVMSVPSNPDWEKQCKDMCYYYGNTPEQCAGYLDATALTNCVYAAFGFCKSA